MAEAMEAEVRVMETLRVRGVLWVASQVTCHTFHNRCGRCGVYPLPPSAPDFDDLVRRKVADAMRDMVCSHAENGNGALSRLLHNETQEDSRSSLPGAVTETEADRGGQPLGEDMGSRGGRQGLKRWMMW